MRKNELVRVRVTTAQKRQIERKAKRHQMTVAEFVRAMLIDLPRPTQQREGAA